MAKLLRKLVAVSYVGLVQCLPQQSCVGAVTSKQAGRTNNADCPCTVVKIIAAFLGQLLQIRQADIHSCNGDDLAVFDHWKGERGYQRSLARCIVKVGR